MAKQINHETQEIKYFFEYVVIDYLNENENF